MIAGAVRAFFPTPADDHDLAFGRRYAHVFNDDLSQCALSPETSELWETLSQSRTARAIAHSIPFFPWRDASEWLRLLESSMSLTYEGKPVRYTVLFATSTISAREKLGNLLLEFSAPLEIDDALLRQKWIRRAVDSQRVALVATGDQRERKTSKHGGRIIGLLSYSELDQHEPEAPYAPHASLRHLQAVVGKDEVAMTVSPTGDLWVLLDDGCLFAKSQGHWFYLNYHHAHALLAPFLGELLTMSILRAAIDLSFERAGALLCIPDDESDVDAMVADRRNDQRPNRVLRESLSGLAIHTWKDRQLIAAAASVDGATVLSKAGKVLDVGCMISRPLRRTIHAITGTARPESFAGARSTAAWNASIYGTAIKVSEDGPVTIFRHGKQLMRIGSIS